MITLLTNLGYYTSESSRPGKFDIYSVIFLKNLYKIYAFALFKSEIKNVSSSFIIYSECYTIFRDNIYSTSATIIDGLLFNTTLNIISIKFNIYVR